MRRRLHALAIAAAVAVPHAASVVSQSLNPPYLSEMPSVQRVKAEIKGSDPIDTSARQMGAFWQIMEFINTLAGPRWKNGRNLLPDEERVKLRYMDAWQQYQYKVNAPPPEDEPRWRKLREVYEKDPALRDELLQRFFTAEFRSAYSQGTGMRPPPSAGAAPATPRGAPAQPAAPVSAGSGPPKSQAPAATATVPASSGSATARAVAHMQQGGKYWKARDYEKAIAEHDKAIELQPETRVFADAFAGRGHAFLFLGQYDKAIADLLEAVKLNNTSVRSHSLGQAYEKTLQFEKAAAAYKEAARIDPTFALAFRDLGSAYLILGRKPEAMQVYSALLKLDKKEGQTLLEDIDSPGGPAAILVKKAQIEIIMGGRNEADAYVHHALTLKPTDPDVLSDIAMHLDIAGQDDEALAVYRRILEMKPDVERQASVHAMIGIMYLEHKDYAKALSAHKESDRLKPSHGNSQGMGEAYFALKQFPDALAAFQNSTRLKSDYADGHFWIGKTHVAMKEFEKAIPAFQEVARLEPKDARGSYQVGHANFQLKRFPDAITALRKAISIDPKHAQAHFGLGMIYRATGRKAEAMRVYDGLKTLNAQLAEQLLKAIQRP